MKKSFDCVLTNLQSTDNVVVLSLAISESQEEFKVLVQENEFAATNVGTDDLILFLQDKPLYAESQENSTPVLSRASQIVLQNAIKVITTIANFEKYFNGTVQSLY